MLQAGEIFVNATESEQTEHGTVEIAYLNDTIVSVLKLDEKGESTCHATMLPGQRNGCGAEFGL